MEHHSQGRREEKARVEPAWWKGGSIPLTPRTPLEAKRKEKEERRERRKKKKEEEA